MSEETSLGKNDIIFSLFVVVEFCLFECLICTGAHKLTAPSSFAPQSFWSCNVELVYQTKLVPICVTIMTLMMSL